MSLVRAVETRKAKIRGKQQKLLKFRSQFDFCHTHTHTLTKLVTVIRYVDKAKVCTFLLWLTNISCKITEAIF